MRGIAETLYQIVKIIPRLPRTLPNVADKVTATTPHLVKSIPTNFPT
ncbi:unnamed protein product, partial [Rotaria magnacalcarata]